MHRYLLVALSVLGLIAPARAAGYLIIVLDDLGVSHVSAYLGEMYPGYTPVYVPDTPTIDGLAGVGLRFTDAWANPVCSPTRASLLTGQYPFQHDVGSLVGAAPDLGADAMTLPELLRDVAPGAPESGLFGKWHLGTSTPGGTDWTVTGEYGEAPAPGLHGFVTYAGSLVGQLESYRAWTNVRWPVLLSGGTVGATVTSETAWAPDVTVTDAIDWIALQGGDWLAVVSLNSPHLDVDGEREAWELDDLAPERLGQCVDRNGDGTCSNAEIYATLVEDADARVQALLEGILAADPGRLEDTVIFLLGDNGTPAGLLEAPWAATAARPDVGKGSPYESGVRIPFVIARGCDWMDRADGAFDGSYGGAAPSCVGASVGVATPGLALNLPVQVADVYATIAELAGAPTSVPSNVASLVPCFAATEESTRDCGSAALAGRVIYAETFTRGSTPSGGHGMTGRAKAGSAAIREGNWKLIAVMDASVSPTCMAYEFYDLAVDPFELTDLRASGEGMTEAASTAYESLWLRMRAEIGPDWYAGRDCAGDSAWDADQDTYESVLQGGTDCDDTRADVYPGAVESCNGLDDNCTAGIDEGVKTTFYRDVDRDRYGASGTTRAACTVPPGYVAVAGDCDDNNAAIRPGVKETWYDGVDGNCDGWDDYDKDRDGYASSVSGGTDCNDNQAKIRPGGREIPGDGVDGNCDGSDDT